MPATVMNAAGVMNSPAAAFVPVGMPAPGQSGTSFDEIFSGKLNKRNDLAADLKANQSKRQAAEKIPNRSGPTEKPDAEKADSSGRTGTDKPLLKTDRKGIQKGEDVSKEAEGTDTQPAAEAQGDIEDENVESVLATIMARIAQLLEITVNELQGSFEEMGINPQELLEGGDVSQLVLELVGGNDMTDMLLDGDMLETFNRITEIIGQNALTEDEPILIDLREKNNFAGISMIGKGTGEEAGLQKAAAGLTSKIENPEVREAVEKAFEETAVENVSANVKAQSDISDEGTDSGSFLQEGNKDGTGSRAESGKNTVRTPGVETFVKNIVFQQSPALEEITYNDGVTVRDIVYQLVDSIKLNISEDNTSLQLQLTPENLGKVSLNISSKNGVMTAQIATENETAREAIESQLQILKEAIESRGIRVEAVEVTVLGFNFDDGSGSNKPGEDEERVGKVRGHKKISLDALAEEEKRIIEEEKLEREVMIQQGSTVNYVA